MTLWHWLLRGSDELTMPKTWLNETTRLARYEQYTAQQLQQGSIVKNVAATQRDAFWQHIEAKAEARKKVSSIGDRKRA